MTTPTSAPSVLAGQPVGTRVRITAIDLPPDILQRLLEMGLAIGAECTVVRYAPLGDPLQIRVRGSNLAIRRSEAARIHVAAAS